MAFKDRVAWITGASSGIGEALAYALAERGGRLIISSRRESMLQKVKQSCNTDPGNVFILPLDLEQHDSLEGKARQAIEAFGQIDYLFNNGGISQRSLAVETDISVVKRIMDINFTGSAALTKYVLPGMLERESGHIVVTSSVLGKFGTSLRSAYAASKHALQGYFESLRHEVASKNIKVTIVCPGFIHTDVSINALTADGTNYQKMAPGQKNGMMPDVFAEKLLKAVENNKEEVYIGGKEVMSIYLKRFVPSILDWLVDHVETT